MQPTFFVSFKFCFKCRLMSHLYDLYNNFRVHAEAIICDHMFACCLVRTNGKSLVIIWARNAKTILD